MTNHLTPGPEMDAAVAAAVGIAGRVDGSNLQPDGRFFWATNPDTGAPYEWRPSRNVSDAIAALEATGASFDISMMRPDQSGYDGEPWWGVGFCDADGSTTQSASAERLPEAACRAILAWAEAEGEA